MLDYDGLRAQAARIVPVAQALVSPSPESLPLFFLGPRSEVIIASNIDFKAGARLRFLGDFSGRFYGSATFGDDVKVFRGATSPSTAGSG